MILRFLDCELDTNRQSLIRSGQPVAVEPQVFDLIHLLAENPDRLVTRDEIVERIWDGRIVSESAISARIASARKAVGDDGKRQAVIRTVQKRGLQMAAPVVAVRENRQQPNIPSRRLRYIPGSGGKRLAFLVQGEGTPVIRVESPGWSIEAEQTSPIWRETGDSIARHHRQLCYSTLSLGETGDGQIKIDFEAMAEDIGRLADTAGFDKFALFTKSGGIHSALRFAARYPDRISRMVIHGGYVEGRARREGSSSADDVIRHMIDQNWKSEAAGIGASYLLPYFPEGPLEAIRDAARIFREHVSRETELALRDAINTVDNSALLKHVRCPVLVIHGRGDAVHPVSEARKLIEGLANAELWIMETSNHFPVAGHVLWEEYFNGVLEFLAGED